MFIIFINNHLNSNNTQNNTITNWEECGPCPVFASYTVAFAIQLRKKHGKASVRVAKECHLAQCKQYTEHPYITIRIHNEGLFIHQRLPVNVMFTGLCIILIVE